MKNSSWATAHTSTGAWLMPYRAGIAHSPSPQGQVQVPCFFQSLLTTLHTCSLLRAYSHFQAPSSSWQLLCLHLPNNIQVQPLKNHHVATCWLQERMPIAGKCNSLPYLGWTSPIHICSVSWCSELFISPRKCLARNET